MDIERLKALRTLVGGYYTEFDVGMNTYVTKAVGKELLNLIDEAIARQSVTSEDVQEAIEWLTNTGHSNQYMSGEWTAPMRNHITRKIQETILAALQAYEPWISVKDRLPEKPEYDWVLVHITLSPDGFVGLPHVAELRRGKWFSTEYDLPIEQILQGTVTHWKPLPEPPKGE